MSGKDKKKHDTVVFEKLMTFIMIYDPSTIGIAVNGLLSKVKSTTYSKNSMLYIKEKCFIFLNLLLMTAGCDEAITVSSLVNRALLDHECYYQTSHTT